MIDVDNLPDDVLNSILKNLGWEPGVNDDQLDKLAARVADMSVEEAFRCYCNWHGLLGSWGTTLIKTIDALRSCHSDNATTQDAPQCKTDDTQAVLNHIFGDKQVPQPMCEGCNISNCKGCGEC